LGTARDASGVRRKAMVVNGFELPSAFVQLCEAIQRGEAPNAWGLKENVDAYGRHWEVADLLFECDPAEMQFWTERIRHDFPQENSFQHPGLIDEFTGVANLVRFAHATDGTFYGFDFGADPKEPSVVFCHGYCWRVAPNFASFMALFVDIQESPQWKESMKGLLGDEEEDEEEEDPQSGDPAWEAARAPRSLLAAWAGHYAVLRPEDRPCFEEIAREYAACSEEERREVEAEVRKKLESEGLTDDQWRAHEELWERLRATQPE
jgi:hypothetical protein